VVELPGGQLDAHAAARARRQAQRARALGDRERDPVAVVAPLELDDAVAAGPRAQPADERADLLGADLRPRRSPVRGSTSSPGSARSCSSGCSSSPLRRPSDPGSP